MKITTIRLLPILCAAMFLYAGCAKQELVKKDESLAPAVAKPAAPAPTEIPQDKPIAAREVHSSPLTGDGQEKGATSAALQNALEKIYFNFDSATLSDTARQTLSRNVEALRKSPRPRVRIEGHCDERGSSEYNLALGDRRAQAALRYLTTMGIPAGRLATISYGNEKPADSGHDEAAWAKNRRDEFVVAE